MRYIQTSAQYVATVCGIAVFACATANAEIFLTNEDFEAGGGNNIDNVTGWFDYASGNFWEGAWQTNNGGITPNDTNVVIFSSFDNSSGPTINTTSPDPLAGSYLYQNIGTADGLNGLQLQFDFGAPNDAIGGLTLGLSVAVYAYDGLGTFNAGDNVDIRAAFLGGDSGLTLLDAESFQMVTTGIDDQINTLVSDLDISGAGSQALYLNFNSYRPADTEAWPAFDNVSVIPEPSTYALIFGALALSGAFLRRRLKKSAV